jgi:hypothetical protein
VLVGTITARGDDHMPIGAGSVDIAGGMAAIKLPATIETINNWNFLMIGTTWSFVKEGKDHLEQI